MTPNPTGRCIQGWRRGRQIADLSELKTGEVLVQWSNELHAESLIRVTEITDKPSKGFRFVHLRPTGETIDSRQSFVWYWDVDNPKGRQHFQAEKI